MQDTLPRRSVLGNRGGWQLGLVNLALDRQFGRPAPLPAPEKKDTKVEDLLEVFSRDREGRAQSIVEVKL